MKRLIYLALIASLLGAYIYFLEVPKVKQEQIATRVFGDITSSELRSINVNAEKGTYELVNSEPKKIDKKDPSEGVTDNLEETESDITTKWSLSSYPDSILDKATVEALINAVANFTFDKKLDTTESDLSVYGLLNPINKLKVSYDNIIKEVLFGDKNEFVNGRYFKFSDSPEIYVADETLFLEMQKELNSLRSKTPVKFSDSSVQSLIISNNKDVIEVNPAELNKEKIFKIVKPINVRGSNIGVFDIYRNLRNLQVSNFIDGKDSETLLSKAKNPADQFIVIKKKDGTELEVSFFEIDSKYYFKIKGVSTLFELPNDSRGNLFKGLNAIRDGQQFKLDPYLVNRIVVTKDSKEELYLEKDKNDWIFAKDASKADSPFVSEYINSLSDTFIKEFLPLDDISWKASPYMTFEVSITDNGSNSSKKLIIGSKRDNKYPAIVDSYNEPFLLDEEQLKKITPSLEKFKIVSK
jgi:hypothetical protein